MCMYTHTYLCLLYRAFLFWCRYLEHGIDIDAKFGGSAAVENLRKWVRSQKTQELERVEGERQRVPGSPPGRPLSEVWRRKHGPINSCSNFLFVFCSRFGRCSYNRKVYGTFLQSDNNIVVAR